MNFMLVVWYAVWYTENNGSLIIKIGPEIRKLSYNTVQCTSVGTKFAKSDIIARWGTDNRRSI